MSIEFQHPSGPEKQKAKLSKTGLASIGLLVLLVAVVIGMVVSNQAKNKAMAEKALVIDNAVSHAVTVCKNVVAASSSSEVGDEANRHIQRIEAEKDPLTKANLANDFIGYCMSLTKEQHFIDELNGARNRVSVAVREYRGSL